MHAGKPLPAMPPPYLCEYALHYAVGERVVAVSQQVVLVN